MLCVVLKIFCWYALHIIFIYLLGDLVAALLKVHDGVRDLDVDWLHDGLDVEGPDQPLAHQDQTVCKTNTPLVQRKTELLKANGLCNLKYQHIAVIKTNLHIEINE